MNLSWSPEQWVRADLAARSVWHEQLRERVPALFRLLPPPLAQPAPGALMLPELEHAPSRTRWIFVPGSTFAMGLSTAEEAAARRLEDPPPFNVEEMRPVHQVEVTPMLVMRDPLTWDIAMANAELRDVRARRKLLGPEGARPAVLSRSEAEVLAVQFQALLPTEAQWECLCRGGTRTLFFFGDELPASETELRALVGAPLAHSTPNPFGLRGLFVGEWCRDRFRRTYADASETADFVVRGGASGFWPWQGSEWAYCASSMRLPSCDAVDGMAAARFVVELP